MKEPRWLPRPVVLAIHADQVLQHGGPSALRDEGALDSALERARNRWHYAPDSDLPALAAAYGYGIARNHPFTDGNKRVAFQAMYVFLGLNGITITATEADVVELMFAVASGATDEPALAEWLGSHTAHRRQR